MKEIYSEIHSLYLNLKESLANGYTQLDDIHKIKKDFGDFWISNNIERRSQEIASLKQESKKVSMKDFEK